MRKPTYRDTSDASVAVSGRRKRARVDLGLALLSLVVRPGHELTRYDIAAWCGCTDQAIYLLEKTALSKLANRLQFGRARALGLEL